jgi:hypothetical protein
MESILKSDIFFFITSISICITTVVLIIAGYYIVRILRNIEDMTKKLKKTVSSAEADIGEIGERVIESSLFSFIFGKRKHKK